MVYVTDRRTKMNLDKKPKLGRGEGESKAKGKLKNLF